MNVLAINWTILERQLEKIFICNFIIIIIIIIIKVNFFEGSRHS